MSGSSRPRAGTGPPASNRTPDARVPGHEPATTESAATGVVTRRWLLIGAVILVAFNLRAPIAAVSPVLPDLRAALRISSGTAGLLTALPVLCFAVAAPLVVLLAKRTGPERAITLGLAGIAAGTVLRSTDGLTAAIAGTVLIGLAITVGNVLVPVVIKRDFPRRVGPVTGIYTASLAAGAALTAALTAPIAVTTGWRGGLALWAVLAVTAGVVWTVAFRHTAAPAKPLTGVRSPGVWRSGTAWALALFLGAQSALYYSVTAWLPTLLSDEAGLSAGAGGAAMALYQLAGIASALLIPPLATRSSSQRGLAALIGVVWIATLTGLLVAPGLWLLWSVLSGLAQGAGISMAFTLVILRGRDITTVGRLSGMAQAVGYSVGAAGPLLVGAVHDATGSWLPPLLLLLGVAGAMSTTGAIAGRDVRVGGPPPRP